MMSSYRYDSVFDILASQADQRPDLTALEDSGHASISYSKLLELVCKIGRSLEAAGVSRRDRVAVVLPNGSTMAVALLGVSCLATAVPLNSIYRKEEFRSYFNEIGVTFLVTARGFDSEARIIAAERGIPLLELDGDRGMAISVDGRPVDLPEDASRASFAGQATGSDDIALILLTSGSTGRSKKVPLTHRNICVSVADICRSLTLAPSDRCLCMWEQFHVGGLVDLLLVPLASGGSVICAGSFNAPLFYNLLKSKKPTWFQGVPTTLHELSAFAKRNFVDPGAAPLRFIRSVASSLSPQLMDEIEALFSVPVLQTFGMTEAGPLITTNLLPPARRKPGSVGPSCGPDIRIVAPDGTLLETGQIGEIVVRGPNVVSGYEDAPEANLRSFRGGWFHTGDTGYLDADAYLYLKGRLKEMINRGGEKITPQEIDDVLLTHPAVAQAASFSVKHPTLGEDIGVAVVPRTPGQLTEADVRAFVAERLAAFKVPQKVLILDEMPRDPIGKINRLTLATLANSLAEPKAAEGVANDTEDRLSKIWASELGVEQVGLDKNFFALGGDSLSAVRIALAVEDAFGHSLTGSELLESPTVRQMAKWISEKPAPVDNGSHEAELPSHKSLSAAQVRLLTNVMAAGKIAALTAEPSIKAINMGGTRKPIVWCFNRPAAQMESCSRFLSDDQPMLGLFSGIRVLPFTDDTLEKTAQHYAQALLRLYPDGRFSLGGNCHGSRVAHRLAKILAEQGKPIADLFLIEYFDESLYDYPGNLMLMYSKQSRHRAFLPLLKGDASSRRQVLRNKLSVAWISGEHEWQFDSEYIMKRVAHFLTEGYHQPQLEKTLFYIQASSLENDLVFSFNARISRIFRRATHGSRKKPTSLALKQFG